MSGFAGEILRAPRWRTYDFRGSRVAVVGSGRDCALMTPHILRTATTVKVFLETPEWILPSLPGPAGFVVRGLAAIPPARHTLGHLNLRVGMRDAWTRRLLTPDRRFGSTATVTSKGYLRALADPRCTLITWPVYAVTENGLRTAEGVEHHVDCLVLGPDALRNVAGADTDDIGTRSVARADTDDIGTRR
jgi:cation diffusion facilitator CzcD-associated flavoprotein CzcO